MPASRYDISRRPFPETLPPLEYDSTDVVKVVHTNGTINLDGRRHFICEAFAGEPVALRESPTHDGYDVFYAHHKIAEIDLNQ